MERRLTKRQERFIEEYLFDFNITQAAVRAGYSKVHAGRIGHENLQKVHIQSAIGNRQKQLVVSSGVTPERVVKELTKLAFLEIDELFDAEWNIKNSAQVPEQVKAAITSVSKTTSPSGNTTVKVTLINKLGAIEALGRVLGIFTPDKNRDNDRDLITALREGRERVAKR
ncbi:MAG: terminase small subunit [Magnetococcales bacterium]|nr:terminase small subunit [Magnetococcales bacterium]